MTEAREHLADVLVEITTQLVVDSDSAEILRLVTASCTELLNASATPTVQPCACSAWNDTVNMGRNTDVTTTLSNAGYIGNQDEGVIAVTVKYTYTPFFTQFLTGEFDIQEVSFARGRFGGFITRTT